MFSSTKESTLFAAKLWITIFEFHIITIITDHLIKFTFQKTCKLDIIVFSGISIGWFWQTSVPIYSLFSTKTLFAKFCNIIPPTWSAPDQPSTKTIRYPLSVSCMTVSSDYYWSPFKFNLRLPLRISLPQKSFFIHKSKLLWAVNRRIFYIKKDPRFYGDLFFSTLFYLELLCKAFLIAICCGLAGLFWYSRFFASMAARRSS